MNIDSLLQQAFFVDDAMRATAAIEDAREQIMATDRVGAFSLEVVVPPQPDETWLREHVVRPIIYYCSSSGMAIPGCSGMFVTFFRDNKVYCVRAAQVVAWASKELGTDVDLLIEEYGTGETEHAAPRTTA